MGNAQVAAASVTNTAVVFMAMLPSPASMLASQEIPATLRVNESAAVAVSLGIGLALSFIDDSASPFIMALVTAAAIIIGLEYVLRTNNAALAKDMEYAPDRLI